MPALPARSPTGNDDMPDQDRHGTAGFFCCRSHIRGGARHHEKVPHVNRLPHGAQVITQPDVRAPQVTMQGRTAARSIVCPASRQENRISPSRWLMISGWWLWPRNSNPSGFSLKNAPASRCPSTPIMADRPSRLINGWEWTSLASATESKRGHQTMPFSRIPRISVPL
jgi:hypothetical protein